MKIFCTASADSYITDKIMDGNFRAEDANVGRAGTLDLFKLWGETTINGSGSQNEISRLLVKFDYQKIHDLTASRLNLNGADFKAELKMFDIKAGNAVPVNFDVAVFPLSQAFDEGVGKDVISFGDLDTVNFLTAAYANGADVKWNLSGANEVGALGDASIDIFSNADFSDGNGQVNVIGSQNFVNGTENLVIDVTTLVSATVANQMSNHGFRISFSGSDETDLKTRFVKRFASRHVADPLLRPRIEISFDDSFRDDHSSFFFDLSGSLFLNSYERSAAANVVSGSALDPITGNDCMFVKIRSGGFNYTANVSQHSGGTIDSNGENFITGVYKASFALPSDDTSLVTKDWSLARYIQESGSITFRTYWYSLDGSVGYHTGSLEVTRATRFSANFTSQEPNIHVINVAPEFQSADQSRFRIFGRDLEKEYNSPVRLPIKLRSVIFDKVYYRVRDADSGRLIINFGEIDDSTRVSTDAEGMFFDFHMSILPPGRVYEFEFLVVNRGTRAIVKDPNARFTVR